MTKKKQPVLTFKKLEPQNRMNHFKIKGRYLFDESIDHLCSSSLKSVTFGLNCSKTNKYITTQINNLKGESPPNVIKSPAQSMSNS